MSMIGQTISHYKIVEKLGEGGMGVVYKAEDTKLERTVALKFLAAHLLNDDEAKQRFLREAKSAAALHHPNICTVYEIDEAEGKTFLAMAFLEGETLEDCIAKGPLPLKDALDIGRQVAEGLQAAHAAGVVHRDIKPANILVSPDGRATIMDFGLARLTEASKLTKADQTVGTAAYMSPEQMQGGEVDHRADIWALGCVQYEMVAGVRPFPGEYAQALAFEIVNQDPEPLTGVRAGVPMELEFIAGKCLAKEAEARYQRVDELAVDLRTLSEKLKSGRSTIVQTRRLTAIADPSAPVPSGAMAGRQRNPRTLQALVGLLGLALLASLAALWVRPAPETPEKLVRRFSFTSEDGQHAAVSPDGRYIAYDQGIDGRRSLWLRSLATETSRELPGSEGGFAPFWSPDSLSIGYFNSRELKRLSISGGPPLTLCSVSASWPSRDWAASWSPDGERIIFGTGSLYEVAAKGGAPRELLSPDAETDGLLFPSFLPAAGPLAFLYTAIDRTFSGRVFVYHFDSGESREVVIGRMAVYSPAGYLVYSPPDIDGLTALPFSPQTLEAVGESFPLSSGGRFASLSGDGALVYPDGSGMAPQMLVWRNRQGEEMERVGQAQPGLREFALSPDGRSVAVTVDEPPDIWIQDLNRSTATRLTFDPLPEYITAWSPSGDAVLYTLTNGGLMRKPADGSGEAESLVGEGGGAEPDWSRDGRYLLFRQSGDIFYVEVDQNGMMGEPRAFVATPAGEGSPKISPNGRFVAYVSNDSGRNEVYVREFPGGAGKVQASAEGGAQPRWRSDGKELYYVQDSEVMLVVPVVAGDSLSLGEPQRLFRSADLNFRRSRWPLYDVSADGQRFLTSTLLEGSTTTTIHVVLNWTEELRDRKQD